MFPSWSKPSPVQWQVFSPPLHPASSSSLSSLAFCMYHVPIAFPPPPLLEDVSWQSRMPSLLSQSTCNQKQLQLPKIQFAISKQVDLTPPTPFVCVAFYDRPSTKSIKSFQRRNRLGDQKAGRLCSMPRSSKTRDKEKSRQAVAGREGVSNRGL